MIHLGREELLKEGEVISEKVRKHWIVYVADFFLHSFGCLLFVFAAYFLDTRGSFGGTYSLGASYGAMILIMFVLIFWTSFFFAWTKDYFDVWYVTNQHIIAINQKTLLAREEAFMELIKIQDVSFEKEGILPTVLGYGKLKVQSAGIEQEFIMENVHDVEQVAHRIMELRDAAQAVQKPAV